MSKVTVIIPILNVVAYLRECLDSVIQQTLQEIEIFCIDAGSTDGSLEIQQEYANKDSRIKLLDDIQKSTGYAKNLGIDKANGKYIAIVESDDFIERDMLEKLYDLAEAYDLDMAKGNYYSFLGTDQERSYVPKAISLCSNDYEKVINPQTDNRYFGWDMYTWTGIYKKEFIDQYQIRHNESRGAAFQDVGFWIQTFSYATRVYLLPDYFYHYRRDNPNASVNNPNRTFIMCEEYEYARKVLAKDQKTWQRILPAFYHEMFRSYFVTYKRLADLLKPDFAERFFHDMQEGQLSEAIDRTLFEKDELFFLNRILVSAEEFVKSYEEYKERISINQRKLVDALAPFQECMIFGAGSHGANLQIVLKQYHRLVDAFCDNDRTKQNNRINGVPVLDPLIAIQQYPEGIFVIANKRNSDQIHDQLCALGVEENRILSCQVENIVDAFL